MDVLGAIMAFLVDTRTLTILALIALDLVTGIASALRQGVFDLQEVARFYRSNVLPNVLGYGVVYVAGALGLARIAEVGPLLEAVAQTGGWALVVASLVASIGRNLQETGKPANGGM